MYSSLDIGELLKTISDARLDAPEEMIVAPFDVLIKVCNGVGSEAMPERLREALNKVYRYAQASAAIHDWRYEHSDGSLLGQQRADREFRDNALDEIETKFAWWNWRRWWGERKALIAYAALRKFGRAAWLEAFYKNSTREKL